MDERESELVTLRHRADEAIRNAWGRSDAEPVLERILEIASEGSEEAVFAHRQLAELQIEDNPWTAALHLRHVARFSRGDDVVHALMGLSQALLGNFKSSISAYRRALAIAPRNPWYHHNLGHLIDVALSRPAQALGHLESAHQMQPLESEISASLAHCLARVGRLEEARSIGKDVVAAAPRNADHRALLKWIEDGAPADVGPRVPPGQGDRGKPTRRRANNGAAPGARVRDVVRTLERGMREAGFSNLQVDRARALWADFRDGRRVRVIKPEVYAAAIEYAIALVHGIDGVTKASIARRYGIAPSTLSSRFGEIRDALDLEPGDPRYAEELS